MAPSTKSPLKILLEGKQLTEVLQDDVLLFKPNNGKTFGIGTERVNHSAAIVVMGQAVLMAHIANFPSQRAAGNSDAATLNAINPTLMRLQGLLHQYADKFSAATTKVWVLLSHPDAEHSPALIRGQILAAMALLGFNVNVASYTSIKDNEELKSPRGELLCRYNKQTGGFDFYLGREQIQ